MIPNHRLLVAYAAPYFAYVLIASLAERFVSMEVNYLIRIIVVSFVLLWSRKWFVSFIGPESAVGSSVAGIIAGLIGTFIWILLLTPFVSVADGDAWTKTAFILRLLAAGLLVPVFEEVFIRGYVFRFALQWDEVRKSKVPDAVQTVLDVRSVNDVSAGAWSWAAVIISTIVFALGHTAPEWPASIAYGLLMSLLYIWRKDLLSCIIAHTVTNISLAFYVFFTGKWYLW